ncbi:MAG: energy-coupling factor transport system ATP-binding protein [Clostridiales bacterium]|jgi:energy-coupling factor transport system ATP-binding protein|nr:energy-coupling factor transport system ATP-binding protein [Clostridiales bacterium]MDN5298913.1 energy-coupling factor transport system ATP-binding protein [Clostridiales bacterium]
MSYITFKEVSYRVQGKNLFQNVNLALARGSFTTLVGANGAGKTTFSKMIIGMVKPSEGTVLLDQKNVNDYKMYEIGNKVGYLFQNPNVQIFSPTVREELGFALKYKGIAETVIEAKTEKMIDRFMLRHTLETPAYHLSQGEKQRLALATILMNDPTYLVLDEPTTGLDQKRRQVLSEVLQQIHAEGIGILLISHDYAFIRKMPTDVLSIQNGGIAYETGF